MKWEVICQNYPNTWILFEAFEAHSDNGRRIIDNISVLDTFKDSKLAIDSLRKIHKNDPKRELYVASTNKGILEIVERKWLGVRI
jgi:hypothetical protein